MIMSTITTSSLPSSSTNSQDSSDDGNNGPTSSPLLFFVALGFGVVFTNLWIIVGVKYCFRYNQRNRQLRAAAAMAAENGEPMDMTSLARPRRRRREKKLMTLDETNERFPLIKYKIWRSNRETQGLPSAGGITASPSRAPSEADKDTANPRLSSEIRQSDSVRPRSFHSQIQPDTKKSHQCVNRSSLTNSVDSNEVAGETALEGPSVSKSKSLDSERSCEKPIEFSCVNSSANTMTDYARPTATRTVSDGEDEVEDEPIRIATPPDFSTQPGDTCAICLDLLEDDDEVRGLTCGHAFHAGCIDPWFTNRRACCPLCKEDYYIPKPQAEVEAGLDSLPTPQRTGLLNYSPMNLQWNSTTLVRLHHGARFRPRFLFGRQTSEHRVERAAGAPRDILQFFSEAQRVEPRRSRLSIPQITRPPRPHIPRFLRRGNPGLAVEDVRNREVVATSITPDAPTPSQLEAGNTAR